ncbi:MAG: bifunctional diaminohydroxyphosphoribosylaminopyrimidine deaminase/5-amino-6-(5-phosphoribosylamino)uracil reductase RibD [Rhodobiaceae bacterium]|nr:bifunctional diaminohydroxyphosphoribosylaminopyrimidine deaminase/5-amino-6-(5-phosphoribosylamino)uracil reductase RibD [Rhodobiaceae bacterium]
MPNNLIDEKYMRIALSLSKRNEGKVWPNPSVGCVITNGTGVSGNPIIVGTGWTQMGGRPHAEIVALKQAGALSVGSTVYVTLEPCSHFGVTGPCVKSLISSNVKKVVSAMKDPNPKVNGSGYALLKENGIEVIHGCLEREAEEIQKGFITNMQNSRPWISIKLAFSSDMKIGKHKAKRVKITNAESDVYTHVLRSKYDAILIGSNTYRNDNPNLTVRLSGLSDYSPIRIALSSRGDIINSTGLFKEIEKAPLWVFVSNEIENKTFNNLNKKGAKVIKMITNQNHQFDLDKIFNKLASFGINNILVEGGASLVDSMFKLNLVDDMYLFKSDKIIGDSGVSLDNITKIDNKIVNNLFQKFSVKCFGNDKVYYYNKSKV